VLNGGAAEVSCGDGVQEGAHLCGALRLPGDRVRVRRVERGILLEPMVTDIDA
jgi:antitoxin VapB